MTIEQLNKLSDFTLEVERLCKETQALCEEFQEQLSEWIKETQA